MGVGPSNIGIVRTMDGTRFELDSDSGIMRSAAGRGELVRIDDDLDMVIGKVTRSVKRALRDADPSRATVQFAVALHPEAGFVVSRGSGDAHFVITLEFDSSDRATNVG